MSEIRAKATAGVYAEIMNQIYDSLDKRIREAVSNAFDANAKSIVISVFTAPESRIVISDDGDGMDEAELRDKYVSMGGGDNYNNPETIGRIGIGALSVFALGDTVRIESRKKGSNDIVRATLDFTTVKKAEKHSVQLSEITLGNILPSRAANNDDPLSFTSITIDDISKDAKGVFKNPIAVNRLVEKLERILPVKYREDSPFFDKVHREIVTSLNDSKYSIEVVLNIPSVNIRNYRVYRRTVFTESNVSVRQVIPLYPHTLEGGYLPNLEVSGYIYINDERSLPKVWQGINARVKNVTIDGNTFFGVEEDQEARFRIGGDILIKNINENQAIQSNRSGFALENSDYKILQQYVDEYIREAIKKVRRNVDIESKVKKVVKHLAAIRSTLNDVLQLQARKEDIENFLGLSDYISTDFREFKLEDEIGKALEDRNIEFDIVWTQIQDLYQVISEDDDFITILVSNDLKEFHFDVSGDTFDCALCYSKESDVPLYLKDERTIYVNLGSYVLHDKPFLKIDPGFVEATLILYLNFLRNTSSAQLLYENTINDLASA